MNVLMENEMHEEKYKLITENLEEILGEEDLKKIISERNLRIYWGTAPTGKPHIGYLNPLVNISRFLRANCEVTILIADLHAELDALKSNKDLIKLRTEYYELLIKKTMECIGVNTEKLKFVRGSSFQLSENYTRDVYRMMTLVSLREAQKAGTDVVKQNKNPLLSGIVYPLLQCLDEEYLQVDCQFGGTDQRKIFALAREYLPLLEYPKRIHLMNHMIPSLSGKDKMSSSDINSKINLTDSDLLIYSKLKKAFCQEGNSSSPIFDFLKYVIFPLLALNNLSFTIIRSSEHGACLSFASFDDLKNSFEQLNFHPSDLKTSLASFLVDLLSPIRLSQELITLESLAYPI